jgi:tetratricopeptide (TPR) repeat protein
VSLHTHPLESAEADPLQSDSSFAPASSPSAPHECQSSQFIDWAKGWLVLEIAIHGQALWDRIAKTTPGEQGDVVRQLFDSLLDQFTIAGLDHESVEHRHALVAELRQARIKNAAPDDIAKWPSLTALFQLRSIDGHSLARQIVDFFQGTEGGHTIPLTCRNLDGIARVLPDAFSAWASAIDSPQTVPQPSTAESDANEHLRRGVELLERGEYRSAIAALTAGLKITPSFAPLYARRAEAYRLLGEVHRALADYEIALHLEPDAILPLLGRGVAHLAVGEFAKAQSDAAAVIAISEQQPLAYRTRAAAAIALGDPDAALADLAAAIELDPSDVESLHRRGVLLVDRDEIENAVLHFNRAIELNPQHIPSLLQRAHARRILGEANRAVRDYSEVLRVHPGNAHAFTSRGLAHELAGDRERAIADHTEALRLEPDNVQIYLSRAKIYRVLGDFAKSRDDLDQIVARQPDHSAARYHRSKVALARGQWQAALDDLDEVLRLNPDLAVAYASRAIVRERLNQFHEALADADQAVARMGETAGAHLIRGRIASQLRESLAAVENLTTAIERDRQIPLAYQERSIAYTIQGEYDPALADADRLVALEPGNAQAYAHRSMVHHLRGEIEKSLVDYSKAMSLDPRVIVAGWNLPLADHLRDRTSILLGDIVDGLRFRRNYPGAPAEPEWSIVRERARPTSSSALTKRSERPVPVAPPPPVPSKPAVEKIERPPTEAPHQTPREVADDQIAATSTASPASTTAKHDAVAATTAELSPIVETQPDAIALVETTAEASTPVTPKPAEKKTGSPSSAEAELRLKKPAKKPVEEITPTADDDIVPVDDDNVTENVTLEEIPFEETIDQSIDELFAEVGLEPADEDTAGATPPASEPIGFASAAPATMPQTPAAPTSASVQTIDCPLCRHRLPPAEVLSGGRFRCGSCNAIFFPGAARPAATTPAPALAPKMPSNAAAKARVAAARQAEDDDDPPTLFDRWKRPTPMAITGVVALLLLYFYFPTNLFGNSRHYSVYPATGSLMLEGKPLAKATLVLFPLNPEAEDHPRPKAESGPDGTFKLETYEKGDGAPAGEYAVQVVQMAPPTAKEIKEERVVYRNLLPARYANPQTSALRVRITSGENKLPALELKKK